MLSLLLPALLLLHLTGLMPEAGDKGLSAAAAALLLVFAARKYLQPVKDDIGGAGGPGRGGCAPHSCPALVAGCTEDVPPPPPAAATSCHCACRHRQPLPSCPLCNHTHHLPPTNAVDKSVFEFYAMTEAQQRARLEQLRLETADYQEGEEAL